MREHTQKIVEVLAPMDRYLLGSGYDNALEYINHLIKLEILSFPSGTKVGTWTVPDEWVIKGASLKYVGADAANPQAGPDLLDYKNNPLSVVMGSRGINARLSKDELRAHWHYSDDKPEGFPFEFALYDKEAWGFCLPQHKLRSEVIEAKPETGITIEGKEYQPKFEDALQEGYYDIVIDADYKKGEMKLGVHTIKGESEREILLFAHLDHPFQANDNISGVACLIDLASKLKVKHTVKIIFCPETIGSIAYALSEDISKVDFVIAVDVCGNKNSILLQKAFDAEARINRVAHVALMGLGESYRKGQFRNSIGSDEYAFNDPLIGIPGIMLSSWPYPEYHTSFDTPEIIDYEQIEKTGNAIEAIIKVYEQDFVPVRNFKGPLMRSRYRVQTPNKQVNLSWDYFIYAMDGVKSLAELCAEYGLNFAYTLSAVEKMIEDGIIRRSDAGQGTQHKAPKQKRAPVQGQADVSDEPREVPKSIRKGLR